MSMIGYFLKADDLLVRQIEDGNAGEILFGEEEEQDLLGIDKAWHAIHYVLTGCVWDIPDDNILGQMVLGGEPVSDEDFGSWSGEADSERDCGTDSGGAERVG